MRRRSLRLRLAGASALSIFVAVSLLGLVVGVLTSHQLRSSLDRSLHARALDVARLAVSAPALLTAPGALEAPAGGRSLAVEIIDRHGRVVARSAGLGGRLLPAHSLLNGAITRGVEGYGDATFSGEDIRLHAVPVADAGGPAAGGAVVVSSGISDIESTRRRLAGLIALSALGAAGLGALLAAMLTGSGLMPLRRLSAAAAAVARTGDPSRRMPDPGTGDQLSELAQTLNTMLAALERSQATERRLLADASHELRTPLTSLRGNLAYLARHGHDEEALRDLESEADRLGRLIDDLLTLERVGAAAPPRDAVELRPLVRGVTERRGVLLTRDDDATIQGDAGALERALENLIDNAERHGPTGGRVTAELVAAGGRVRLAVSDEGPGLPADQRERAFERFWRGPAAHTQPGSGLGLALVAAIAEGHGGSVSVRGSRFEMNLPIVRGSSETPSRLARANQGGPPP